MFKFKFKALLEYRKNIEDRCHQQFLARRTIWEKERQGLQEYHARWEKYIGHWREAQKEAGYLGHAELFQQYMVRFKAEISEQVEKVKDALKQMESSREELLKARKNKKSMELLEKKLLARYMKEENEKEKKFVDEIATQQFNGKSLL